MIRGSWFFPKWKMLKTFVFDLAKRLFIQWQCATFTGSLCICIRLEDGMSCFFVVIWLSKNQYLTNEMNFIFIFIFLYEWNSLWIYPLVYQSNVQSRQWLTIQFVWENEIGNLMKSSNQMTFSKLNFKSIEVDWQSTIVK